MDFSGLNPKQLQAVKYVDSPLLVFAGAGSGKTNVIVNKIVYLIEELGYEPSQIIALTFTKKAAEEMKTRVEKILARKIYGLFIGTFHSWGAMFLRIEASQYGISNKYTIIDTNDKDKLIKNILKKLNTNKITPQLAEDLISKIKNRLISAEDYKIYPKTTFQEELLADIYYEYEKEKRDKSVLDFDDLQIIPLKILNENKELAEKYINKYKYVLVDEYQDTNEIQYELVKKISGSGVCVVGDDDQSIYSWRGANVENILRFKKDFINPKTIILDINYRSTQNIIDAAYGVVRNNLIREEKYIKANSNEGEKISLFEAESDEDEALYVISNMSKYIEKEGLNYKDIAIFYRTNAQSRIFEETLVNYNIPYKIYGGLRFYERMEIKDILSYVWFIIENKDDMSLQRIINTPSRGIGPKKISNLVDSANEIGISLKEYVKKYGSKCSELIDFWALYNDLDKYETIDKFIQNVINQTNYEIYLKQKFPENYDERLENIEQLIYLSSKYDMDQESILRFHNDVSLIVDTDISEDSTKGSVNLMTLHASKGLEFKVVFLVGAQEGVIPHFRSYDKIKSVEEERRLFYVGMTRAKIKLHISWSTFSSRNMNFSSPSRFISEIPEYLTTYGE